MNKYYQFLYMVLTHQPCTRFHLEHLGNGRFVNQIDECLKMKLVEISGKNNNNEDLYYITDKGRYIVDNPKGEK